MPLASQKKEMNKNLNAIDLFCGAGGLSCGFLNAGYDVPFAIERDLWASDTYLTNHTKTKLITADICEVDDSEFLKYKGADLVMGGPPCQGFSISASNRRKKDDPRNFLYLQFLRAVSLIKPKSVLIENVKEITKFRLQDGRLLCDDIRSRLSEMGYFSEIITLNASLFGVPQARVRAFIIATHTENTTRELTANITNIGRGDLFNSSASQFVTLWDAISDLPVVEPWKVSEDSLMQYVSQPKNKYQEKMRNGSEKIHNHVPMRHTPRMIERFKHLIDDKNSSTSELPGNLTPRARGNPDIASGKIYDQNHRVLDAAKPAPTITASFYSSFVHPYQPRNLTAREAARLQSFPDTFVFKGKRTTLSKKLLAAKGEVGDLYLDQFNQVGNSVPPLLAEHIANQIRKVISI